jgi:ribosome-interacting GTPase 1
MVTTQEKIEEIEAELKKTKYNKATQHHIGLLKAKLARLKEEHEAKSKTKKGKGFTIKKSGDATVVLIGYPSVGKSSLINKITNVKSKVAAYDFTTLDAIYGTLKYSGAKIQIVDIPGIIAGAAQGKGSGREVLSVARNADLLLIMLDANRTHQLNSVLDELYEVGVRLDQEPPKIRIYPLPKGGLQISRGKGLELDDETITKVLNENRIFNAAVSIKENITIDQLIDSVMKNRVYTKSLLIVNKVDSIKKEKIEQLKKEIGRPAIFISVENDVGIPELIRQIFEKLGFIRVYLKKPGGDVDYNEPLILKEGATIKKVCESIHRDTLQKFLYARLWGPSSKFPEQTVGLNHVLKDSDIVLIVKAL